MRFIEKFNDFWDVAVSVEVKVFKQGDQPRGCYMIHNPSLSICIGCLLYIIPLHWDYNSSQHMLSPEETHKQRSSYFPL